MVLHYLLRMGSSFRMQLLRIMRFKFRDTNCSQCCINEFNIIIFRKGECALAFVGPTVSTNNYEALTLYVCKVNTDLSCPVHSEYDGAKKYSCRNRNCNGASIFF